MAGSDVAGSFAAVINKPAGRLTAGNERSMVRSITATAINSTTGDAAMASTRRWPCRG